MKIKAITISTTNGGIGWNDKLPWFSISIVDKNFNESAKDNVVLIGRSAFENHTNLRGLVNYVYTTKDDIQETDTIKRASGSAQDIIERIKSENPDKDIIIAGGETVYRTFYDLIDEWKVTIIDEFVPYNKDINLTNIQYIWNNKVLLNSGIDNNLQFRTYLYSKKNA
jgi:dihydrofolate reductase